MLRSPYEEGGARLDSTPNIRYTSGYMHTVAGVTEHELDYCILYFHHYEP